ncbi:hypothetical protein V8E53_006782 [Lactarius tabidus]
MALDPESIDYRTIFPPGILAPPSNPLLPLGMSRTPEFGNNQAMNDRVNPSLTPSAPPQDAITRTINSAVQPMWAAVHRLEAKIDSGPPRAPPQAGPGYRAKFIHHSPVPKVSAAPATLLSSDSGLAVQSRIQAADPIPLADFIPHEDVAAATPTPLASAVCELPRLDNEEFPALELDNAPSTSCKKCAKAVVQRQWQSVPGALGSTDQNTTAPLPRRNGDDGHIPTTSHQSRIRPLFTNVITQAAVAQQQQVKCSADQACTVQGRNTAGKQGPCPSLQDTNLTEVTVIRFGGLEDEEEERKFRACNPIQIVQSMQRDLARRSKNPPAVLSGHWSQSVGLTGNFVYTLGGIIPPCNIVALKSILCALFSGCTEVVPTKGWTWIQLCQVPTEDDKHCIWGPDDLLTAFRQNPCFQDTLICVQPHWQGNPLTSDKAFSTVLAAIIDDDNSVCQAVLTHGVQMFGAQVKFLHCRDNPTLQQCGRCHQLGHYSNSPRCKLPKGALKCYQCGGNHNGRDHDYECSA